VRLAVLNLAIAVVLTAAANQAFWGSVMTARPAPLFLGAVAIGCTILVNLFLTAVTWGRLAKPALYLVVLASAAAAYFTTRYGVLFDRDMVANMVETDVREARELLSPGFVLWMLGFGLLPCLAISRIRLRRGDWRSRLAEPVVVLLVSALVLGGLAAAFYQPFASLLRNHRELRFQMIPLNLVGAGVKYTARSLRRPRTLETVGTDARLVVPAGATARRRVTVVVVGETARAANFSLMGYPRETNPELARRDVLVLRNVHSCGTATTTSVPCMFQDGGREAYRSWMATGRENLLDVLQRAGVQVLWRENNGGCKHVCDRVPHENLAHLDLTALCPEGQCYDEVLLHRLQERLDGLDGDAVIVLHMLGSHGPAYHKRYPSGFATYRPACETGELERCTREQIVNAYDNTIRYTDHVLGEVVNLLARNATRFDGAMLYVSDHGESLGEHGLYLHGVPYAMAPEEQTHVPMVVWLSQGHRQRIDPQCLRRQADRPLSHDNLYHSILGLMRVQTSVYRRERDLFSSCAQRVS